MLNEFLLRLGEIKVLHSQKFHTGKIESKKFLNSKRKKNKNMKSHKGEQHENPGLRKHNFKNREG